jgi:hypothetical protein
MDLSAVYASSWQRTSNVADVTLHVKASGALTPIVAQPALRRAASAQDLASEPALLEKTMTVFHLWAENLPDGAAAPKKGDKVEEADGTTWTVRSVESQCMGQRFRCLCLLDRGA